MKRRRQRKPSQTRIIGYKGAYPEAAESDVVRALERATAAGLTTQTHAKRGIVWFEGPPGAAFRRLRNGLRRLGVKFVSDAGWDAWATGRWTP